MQRCQGQQQGQMQDVNKSCGLGLGLGLQLTALPPPALASCYSAPATVLASASAWIIGTHAHLNLNCPKMIVHSRNKGPLSPFCPRPQKLLARRSLFIVAGTFLYAAYLWITAGHQGQGGGCRSRWLRSSPVRTHARITALLAS